MTQEQLENKLLNGIKCIDSNNVITQEQLINNMKEVIN